MLTLRLFGTADLRDDAGGSIQSVLAQPKRFALLAHLALACGYCRRDTLTALFWPDVDQEHARRSLRQATHYLRRSLGPDVILGRGDEELGLAEGALACDAVEFREAIEAGEWERALGTFSGEVLPGFFLSDLPEFERWLEGERKQIRAAAGLAAAQLASLAAERGDEFEAIRWLEKQLELDPTDEVVLRRLLERQGAVGDRAGALQTYAAAADHLRHYFGAEPSAETRSLIEEIRARDTPRTEPSRAIGADSIEPRDLSSGSFRAPSIAAGTRSARSIPPRAKALAIAAAVLIAVIGAMPLTRDAVATLASRTTERNVRASVAVLPIVDIGQDAGAEYLADGLTDELISVLGQVPHLWVSSRTSSYAFKGASTDVREIGRRLGVQHVLEGSVRESDGRVRFSFRLINVADGRQLWSEIYDRATSDILDVQEEIGQAVVSALQGNAALGLGRAVPALSPATANPSAYDDYLRGKYLLRDRSRQRVEASLAYFNSAIRKDPDYSLAYAGLSQAYLRLGNYRRPEDVLPLAKQAAQKALALNDELAETHLSLGYVLLFYDWDWAGAEREFKRAIEIDPNLASVHYGYAEFLKAARRDDEMLREIRRALAIEGSETVDPIAFAEREHAVLASAYLASRQYELALAHAQSAVQLNPGSAARFDLIRASIDTGDLSRAAAELGRVDADGGARDGEAGRVGRAYAMVGNRREALSILENLQARASREYVPQDQIGTIYLGLGETDKALTAFERAVRDRHWFVVHLNSDPIFDGLREHPRFKTLLEQIHAPDV